MPTKGRKRLVEKYCARFGKLAVEMGFITKDQLRWARKIQVMEYLSTRHYKLIGQILFEVEWMTPHQIDQVLHRLFENKEGKEEDLNPLIPSLSNL